MSRNSKYTQKYKDKRQSKEIRFNLYLDDKVEAELFHRLQKENKKQLITTLLYEHYENAEKKTNMH